MDEDKTYPAEPALDALMIVIAELLRAEAFTFANLANIKRRLELSGHEELADRVAALPIANAIDTPENNREGMRLVDCDGGNADD